MRIFFLMPILTGLAALAGGCADRPELAPSAYGTVLSELPSLKAAETPFPFPAEGENDHQNCKFNEFDFL